MHRAALAASSAETPHHDAPAIVAADELVWVCARLRNLNNIGGVTTAQLRVPSVNSNGFQVFEVPLFDPNSGEPVVVVPLPKGAAGPIGNPRP